MSISPGRFNILRSADGGKTWEEVFSFKGDAPGQGLREAVFGYVTAK